MNQFLIHFVRSILQSLSNSVTNSPGHYQSMSSKKHTKQMGLFEPTLIKTAIRQSFVKLNPALMVKNPVMFTVEIGTAVMLLVIGYILLSGDTTQGSVGYNITIFVILLLTLL